MKNVFFKPWVGENYKTAGFNGKRILVLGESCYCGECPGCVEYDDAGSLIPFEKEEGKDFEICRDKIIDVVNGFITYKEGEPKDWSMKTYRCFTDVFMGHRCTLEETKAFWHSFVLYNYIQTALEKSRIPPKQWQWETGKKPFFEVLAEYNPDVIIVWSKELWNNMPTGFRLDDSFQNKWKEGLRYYNNGKRDIPAYACYHPSTYPTYFNDEDTLCFKRLLEKIA
ncbi:MAG: hypothetical protein LBC76_09890 [Treponema sp.]|jgi:hypothetical protein|nr:hypothetical protein [Treponema sp.]